MKNSPLNSIHKHIITTAKLVHKKASDVVVTAYGQCLGNLGLNTQSAMEMQWVTWGQLYILRLTYITGLL